MAKRSYFGFFALGFGLIAVGIALSSEEPGLVTFIFAGLVFICIGIIHLKKAKSADEKRDKPE